MDPNKFSFGLFHLDPSQHQLTREGVPVSVGNRALDILCVLAAAKGEIVSKDELMTKVWPGLVVEENNIEVHVSALRKVLDEGKGSQTHLVTVPGRGYRLVGVRSSLRQRSQVLKAPWVRRCRKSRRSPFCHSRT